MAEKKTRVKKKKAGRKAKPNTPKKPASRRKTSAKKVRAAAPKATQKKKRSKPAVKEVRSPERSTLSGDTFATAQRRRPRKGTGSAAAGQSGDLQGLSRSAFANSESIEELLEEGQAGEAAAISGVEDALDPDEAEVYTREVPEDDVPDEYFDED